jgi:hypothetical protein
MAKLPYDISIMRNMYSYLDKKLENCSCDHLLFFSMEFVELHQLNIHYLAKWLKATNIDCDCKVHAFIKKYAKRQLLVVK